MLTNDFVDRANRAIEAGVAPRRRELPIVLAGIDARASQSGAFRSGGRLSELREAIAQDLRARAVVIWAALVRVHRTLGSTNDGTLRQDLRADFDRRFEGELRELSEVLNQRVAQSGMNVALDIGDVFAESRQKHEIEIDLYVDSLLSTGQGSSGAAPPHVYNFYGTVGAVQTGAAASAHFVQNLTVGEKASLVSAIDGVKRAVASSSAPNRDELIRASVNLNAAPIAIYLPPQMPAVGIGPTPWFLYHEFGHG